MKTVEEFEADIAIAYSLNLGTDPVQIKTQGELEAGVNNASYIA
ncbi:MAG: hypothetical protein AB8U91_03330 [Candidatus Midichloria sp.]|uniref:Uncharacterized protein n=1 Tax=Hyalomma marginatum TaxID=34627 RepID=A0A8S4BU34_9ACAR|nr:hypothetical protein MHYMCMPASI_00304 [Hyalomma marginatum]CAG7592429.1 hypothetical protein MHYMCMPSP_00661 [Hyalomma marginatum]